MIAAVIILAAVVALLVVAHAYERRQWAGERRGLVDRAIAKDIGEVIAIERAGRPAKERPEPKYLEGLS